MTLGFAMGAGGLTVALLGPLADSAGPQAALWMSGALAALAVPAALSIGGDRRFDPHPSARAAADAGQLDRVALTSPASREFGFGGLDTAGRGPSPAALRTKARQDGGVVVGYAYSPRALAHDPPPSTVQIAGRAFTLGSVNVAQAVLTAQAHDLVERSALAGRLARITPVAAPEEALLAVHTAAYLRRLREAGAGGPWDGEFAPVTPATWEAARLAVGGVLAAVDAVLDGGIQRALVHARPAGHHAEPDRAIASTYLNNVACGVEHARARGVERVAIIDWDVHVANGAERIFWDRDDVLAISLHQQDWYPAHAGALDATGGSGAQGSTVNVPLPPATTDSGFLLAFDDIVAPVVRGFRPDLIMVAAGQDASVFDPTARMMVSAAGFRALAERVAHLADELAGGRLVVSTEGGYSPIYNPFCLLAVLEGLAGESAGVPDPWHDDATVRAARALADDRVRTAVADVRRAQPRWFP